MILTFTTSLSGIGLSKWSRFRHRRNACWGASVHKISSHALNFRHLSPQSMYYCRMCSQCLYSRLSA